MKDVHNSNLLDSHKQLCFKQKRTYYKASRCVHTASYFFGIISMKHNSGYFIISPHGVLKLNPGTLINNISVYCFVHPL